MRPRAIARVADNNWFYVLVSLRGCVYGTPWSRLNTNADAHGCGNKVTSFWDKHYFG